MAFYFYFLIALIVSCYAEEKIGAEVQVVKDVNEYLLNNPDAKPALLQRSVEPRQIFHYTIGNRVKGDTLVGQGSEYFTFPAPRDYQHKLWYPVAGLGARVSRVDIWVDQTSNVGNAYVIGGGIGQRSITVLIEAKYTTLFSYKAEVYGY